MPLRAFTLAAVVLGGTAPVALADPVVVEDGFGNSFEVASSERIIPIYAFTMEILAELDALDRVVARTEFTSRPEAIRDLPSVGSYTELSAEGLLSLDPDLIIIPDRYISLTPNNEVVLEQVQAAGVSVVVLPRDLTIEAQGNWSLEVQANSVRMVGEALGIDAEATALIDQMRAEEAEIRAAAIGGDDAPVILGLTFFRDGEFMSLGTNQAFDYMVEMIGGDNPQDDAGFVRISPEGLAEMAPDVITISPTMMRSLEGDTDEAKLAHFVELPGVRETPAAQNDAIAFISTEDLYGSGPHNARAALTLLEAATASAGSN